MDRARIRQAFRRRTFLPVKVTPRGFQVDDHEYEKLRGRVIKESLVRKLFDEGLLVCSSPDGIRAVDGTLCESCQHPRCQPRLRLQLALERLVYVVDLVATSAENFFVLADETEAAGDSLDDWLLELHVLDHDSWGEVVFERVEKFSPSSPKKSS